MDTRRVPELVWSEAIGEAVSRRLLRRVTDTGPNELRALEHCRRMRGGAQAHLMRCSDENYYVVKFPNNPQGIRILANDLLGGRLAARMGLPVASAAVVRVDEALILHSEEMVIQLGHRNIPCQGGLCFGSQYATDPRRGAVYDFLTEDQCYGVENIRDFAGMLVFDLWTCNTDGRQVVFSRKEENSMLLATMIDQGFCFNANEWNFPDSPLLGPYYRQAVYKTIRGMETFEPWLGRLECEIDENVIFACAEGLPPEWCGPDMGSLWRLLERLNRRRTQIRDLISSVRRLPNNPFPNWVRAARAAS
jgi:hypothetical protein